MPASNKPRTVRFEPVGRCIYCGTSKGLTDEHIVPYGLHGRLVLLKASCSGLCKDITSQLERVCLQGTFGPLRIRHKMPTRHPKQRPDRFPVEVECLDGTHLQETISASQLPGSSWALPILGHCGFVLKKSVDELPKPALKVQLDREDMANFRQSGRKWQEIGMGHICIETFGRMLAKIGHAYACAVVGPDAFDPWLPDLILKGTPNFRLLVGGQVETEISPAKAYLYELQLITMKGWYDLNCLGVAIRLFSCFRTPWYYVVVGSCVGNKFPPFKVASHRAHVTLPPRNRRPVPWKGDVDFLVTDAKGTVLRSVPLHFK